MPYLQLLQAYYMTGFPSNCLEDSFSLYAILSQSDSDQDCNDCEWPNTRVTQSADIELLLLNLIPNQGGFGPVSEYAHELV